MKVSCICVTQPGREHFLEDAISCFDSQDYPADQRELVIVRDNKDGTTLGELRNAGIGIASGEYVMTWDDDDLCAPTRISQQVAELEREAADICFLRRIVMRCSCGAEFDSHDRKGGWECSMLARRSKVMEYPPIGAFEDKMMIDAMLHKGARRVTMHGSSARLYVKRYHGENTIDLDGHRMIFRKAGHNCREMQGVATT
jgi:glycosyltransferase involved in cell wall biosynthesis